MIFHIIITREIKPRICSENYWKIIGNFITHYPGLLAVRVNIVRKLLKNVQFEWFALSKTLCEEVKHSDVHMYSCMCREYKKLYSFQRFPTCQSEFKRSPEPFDTHVFSVKYFQIFIRKKLQSFFFNHKYNSS